MNDTKNEEIEPREIKESESKTGKRSLFVRVCDRINKEWLVWTMAIAAVLVIVCPMPRDVHVAFSVIFAAGILYASYFFVSGWLFSENTDNHILSGIRTELRKIPQDVLFKFSCPVWIFFTAECIVGDYASIDILHRIMNVALLILLYKVIAIIMRNIPLYILVASLGVMIFYISSYFITIYRSRPITPWDFFGIGTVLDVTPHYSFSLNIGMIAGLVLCVVMYLIMKMLPKRKHRISKYYIVYPLLILLIMVFSHNEGYYHVTDTSLCNTYKTEGTPISFAGMSRQYILTQPKKPNGYSRKKVAGLSERMDRESKTEKSKTKGGITPKNVIVIMNESFADMNAGGTNIADGTMPFYSSLKNTVRGSLYVSVRGGGTCNTEYEALTGNTMAFFPAGVYPFSKYMGRKTPSMASYFDELGYRTTGMHLGNPKNWGRQDAYEKMGFKRSVFAESFDGLDTLHGYPTDEEHYKRIIKIFKNNKKGKNFIFTVTFQNHGDYADTDDLKKTFDLSQYGELPKAENYFSLIKISDAQFRKLVGYFKKVKEPTMIVMFGDHQPSLGTDSDDLLFPGAISKESQMKKYTTPFLIWANYPIKERNVGMMSVNFLQSLIVKTGNLPETPYQQFLGDLWKKYPVITMVGCYNNQGEYIDSAGKIKRGILNEYRWLQYNNVFDRKRSDKTFRPDPDSQY